MTHLRHGAPAAAPPACRQRRFLVAASSVAVGALAEGAVSSEAGTDSEATTYEVQHSDAEWRARLSEVEYLILRTGKTEQLKSSPLWNTTANGYHRCKGCNLTNPDAYWKVVLDKGWVFFRHAQPNAVMTGIEGPVPAYGAPDAEFGAFTEVRCRRCGSHLGHLLQIEEQPLHCISEASLNFQPEAA